MKTRMSLSWLVIAVFFAGCAEPDGGGSLNRSSSPDRDTHLYEWHDSLKVLISKDATLEVSWDGQAAWSGRWCKNEKGADVLRLNNKPVFYLTACSGKGQGYVNIAADDILQNPIYESCGTVSLGDGKECEYSRQLFQVEFSRHGKPDVRMGRVVVDEVATVTMLPQLFGDDVGLAVYAVTFYATGKVEYEWLGGFYHGENLMKENSPFVRGNAKRSGKDSNGSLIHDGVVPCAAGKYDNQPATSVAMAKAQSPCTPMQYRWDDQFKVHTTDSATIDIVWHGNADWGSYWDGDTLKFSKEGILLMDVGVGNKDWTAIAGKGNSIGQEKIDAKSFRNALQRVYSGTEKTEDGRQCQYMAFCFQTIFHKGDRPCVGNIAALDTGGDGTFRFDGCVGYVDYKVTIYASGKATYERVTSYYSGKTKNKEGPGRYPGGNDPNDVGKNKTEKGDFSYPCPRPAAQNEMITRKDKPAASSAPAGGSGGAK